MNRLEATNFRTRLAVYILTRGGVIALPTDTIIGLSCLPKFEIALDRLFKIKRRSGNKGLILLAHKLDYFSPYVKDPTLLAKITLQTKPTTYLLEAGPCVGRRITGDFTSVALRLTEHPLISYLCSATKSVLVSTSANISGGRCAKCMLDLKKNFHNECDLLLTPQSCDNNPSQIIDLKTGERLR